jgi:hypothetical protein
MNDLELKDLLLSTCPVLPGQEARAWSELQGRLSPRRASSLFAAPWRSFAYGALALLLVAAVFDLGLSMRPSRHAISFADSQSPGIYATAFYSTKAQAQVVWLNGMEPASDRPTYLDPTTVTSPKAAARPGHHPDSL